MRCLLVKSDSNSAASKDAAPAPPVTEKQWPVASGQHGELFYGLNAILCGTH